MLNMIRTHINSWIIKSILLFVVLIFLFWGFSSFNSTRTSDIVKVNNDFIDLKEYKLAYNNYLLEVDKDLQKELVQKKEVFDTFKKIVLNRLINHKLIFQEASKLGFKVTDLEIIDSIKSNPIFMINDIFDFGRYKDTVTNLGFLVEDFELKHKEFLLVTKFIEAFYETISISDLEILVWHEWLNSSFELSYAFLNLDDPKILSFNDKELQFFFEKYKNKYKKNAKARVEFIKFDPRNYSKSKVISNNKILEYYNDNQAKFFIKKNIDIRHIFIKSNVESRHNNQGKSIALNLRQMIYEGGDFSEILKTYSECVSRINEGKIINIEYDSINKLLADKIFFMNEGEVSSVIETEFGWHIVKIDNINEEITIPLEEVTDKIIVMLNLANSKFNACTQGVKFYELSLKNNIFSNIAINKFPYYKTEWFYLENGPIEFDHNNFFVKSIINKMKENEISDLYDINGIYYIFRLNTKVNSNFVSFEEVEPLVSLDFGKYRKQNEGNEKANYLIESIETSSSFEKFYGLENIILYRTRFFIKDILSLKNNLENVFFKELYELCLRQESLSKILEIDKDFYILSLKKRKSLKFNNFLERDRKKNKTLIEKKSDLLINLLTEIRENSNILIGDEYQKI